MTQPDWLGWVARLQAIAQAGLELSDGPYDLERYKAVRDLAAEIAAAHLELPVDAERLRLDELLAGDGGYPTPKVDVRALVRRDGEVLLVRERADGRWSLPGGWADVGWSPAAMVEREVAEESGFQVRARRLLALWDRSRHNPGPFPHSVYKVAVACDLLGGSRPPQHRDPGRRLVPALGPARAVHRPHHRGPDRPPDRAGRPPELPPDLD